MKKILAIAFVLVSLPLWGENVTTTDTSVTSSAQSSIFVMPDAATIDFSIEIRQSKVDNIMARADEVMTQIKKGLEKQGFKYPLAYAGNMSLYSELDYQSNQLQYKLTVYLRCVVEDLSVLNKALDMIVTPYINDPDVKSYISGISYIVKNPAVYYPELREKALATAKTDAENEALALGAKLGDPIYFSESAPLPGDYMYYPYSGWRFDTQDKAQGTPLPRILVTYDVYVTYLLLNQ